MPTNRILKTIGIVLAVLALLVYVAYLGVYVAYAANLFRWPFDYDQGEGFELYDAILYSQGEWPYRDNAVYPFYASNYPPLFHLLIVPLLPVFGHSLTAGRVVSFTTTLITAATIFAVVRRQMVRWKLQGTGIWLIPTISGLAFLASNYVYQIGPLCRMHMTMVMFETLAVAFIAEFEHPQHGKRNLALGLLMLLCAGYTKQMAVFTVVAALFYVLLRDVKKAIVSGAVLAAVAGVIFWLLNVATDGQWWVNTIQANVNAFSYLDTIFYIKQWFRVHILFAVLAGGYLVYELFWDRLSAYSLWFLLALGTGALSGKWGAGPGYFTTAIAAGSLLSGLAFARLQKAVAQPADDLSEPTLAPTRTGRPAWLSHALAIAIPLLYVLQATRMVHLPTEGPIFEPLARALGVSDQLIQSHDYTFQYHDSMGYTQLGHLLTDADYAAGKKILNYVRTADGPAFSEEAMFSILVGEPVITNPTQLLNLYNNDLLDTTEIVARINRQEFGVAIFRAQFYPPPVLEAFGQNYTPVDHVRMNGFLYAILWPNRMLDPPAETP